MKIFSILLVVILSVKSCGDSSNSNNSEKLSGEFHIVSLEKNSSLPDNLTIYFHSETKKISGFSGCNNYFGNFILEEDVLSFGAMGSTRKMCFSDANNIETEILQFLSKINGFSFKNNTLQLKSNDNILITAKK
ncbi:MULTISPECIES: META domain-containing protein [unclassified Algibacter]|uniref:META domain-containing protein n=1 Tax=unclassified Algibacter TaxID=2615009 RepID=UPI00131D6E2C|nr:MULTISPECIES: META domain-containing protein [unclassified Algibacter]MCL5126998.1 META domain-containing protein [Algibacter sp. L4_22]